MFLKPFKFTAVALLLAISVTAEVNVEPIGTNEEAKEKHLELRKPKMETFTALTKPLPLYPGEVTNTFHTLKIPPGPIAVYEFSADIVEKDAETGEIIPVPLKDAYLHHHVAVSNHKHYEKRKHWWSPMKPKNIGTRGVGFGAGTESRGTPQKFPFPYAFTTIEGEDELIANVHVINTREMDIVKSRRCLECPCTLEDRSINYHKVSELEEYEKKHGRTRGHNIRPKSSIASITGDGTGADVTAAAKKKLLDVVANRREDWGQCNDQLMEENNTACSPSSYYGGLICCEHGEFCLDEFYLTEKEVTTLDLQYKNANESGVELPETTIRRSTFYLRYTLSYAPVVPENQPLYLASCCDASGNMTHTGNVEYDIPQLCDPSDPAVDLSSEDCVHELVTVQSLHGKSNGIFGTEDAMEEEEKLVDVVYIVGHLHRGGMEMSAFNEETNELLCRSLPTYGNGTMNEIGNEPGYINSMSACSFDPPLRMKTTDRIKVVGKYNATQKHTGVMSLLYVAMADVPGNNTSSDMMSSSSTDSGFWKQNQFLAILLAVVIVIAASFKVASAYRSGKLKRQGYEQVPNGINL